MRPVDFYALPAKRTEAWHESYGAIQHFFDDEALESDVDRDLGKTAPTDGPSLTFETKLSHNGDGERTVNYSAAYLDRKPFALVARAGRGGDEYVERVITDIAAYNDSLSLLRSFLPVDVRAERDVSPDDEELSVLSGFYNYEVVTAHAGDVRLVPEGHLDAEGRILLDEVAYRESFDRIVRPAFDTKHGDEEWTAGIRGERMQALTAQALLESLPEGVTGTVDFHPIPKSTPDNYIPVEWCAVIAANDEGTYAIGLPGFGMGGYFAWGDSLRVHRLGGPELFEALAHEAPSAPAP